MTATALHDLLVASAARDPGAPAVAGPCGSVTYGELDEHANLLANTLAGFGVARGDRVLILGAKSVGSIAAMQAVLRLGAAYVPIDPLAPADRVALIAKDCGARTLCAPNDPAARVADLAGSDLVLVDPDGPFPPDARLREPVNAAVDPNDLAYILFTSGSTGVPKGVCISHRNALAFIEWAVAELGAHADDRFANHASFSFDLSVLDLYAAFAAGAAVCPIPAQFAYAPERLVDILYRERITIWYSVPSVLSLMLRDGGLVDRPAPENLRAVLFAGEPFAIEGVRRLAGWTGARLLNFYGPTETNVCTWHEVRAADLERDAPVPIGAACSGDAVWAGRPDGTPAGPGEEGELLVSGPTVFLGYWGGPRTPHPYRTGDRVRVRPDGSFDYLGRTDSMVKIRGHRVELGEVTAALQAHPQVAEAATVTRGEGLERRLVAYVVRAPGSTFGGVALRRHLARRLAPQMIPEEICFVDRLPRNERGKLDRAALPPPTPTEG